MTIKEYSSNDSNTATQEYIYEYSLENGTILNLSEIDEDVYVDVYVPITDLELAKFNLTKEYSEQGYDIYDKNNIFYTDYCTPASFGGNDITLADRKKDIYPNNVTLCQSNCKYSGVNIEEQRVICSCNLNSEKDEEDEEFEEEDDGNFITYFLDNINYRVFECYQLFFDFNNLKNCYFFYVILSIFGVLQIMNCIFFCHSLGKLKTTMLNEALENKEMIKKMVSKKAKVNKIAEPTKKVKNKNNNKKVFTNNYNRNTVSNIGQTKTEKNTFIFLLNDKHVNNINNINNIVAKKKHKSVLIHKRKSNVNKNNKNKKTKFSLIKKIKEEKREKKDEEEEEINELPYAKAIIEDKRNIFRIFYSFIIEKLELISIFCSNDRLKIMLFIEYILSLLMNFFFNSLLYTDDVVSNKYHNNGELDFFVSLTISLLSNIVTSIIYYYSKSPIQASF